MIQASIYIDQGFSAYSVTLPCFRLKKKLIKKCSPKYNKNQAVVELQVTLYFQVSSCKS